MRHDVVRLACLALMLSTVCILPVNGAQIPDPYFPNEDIDVEWDYTPYGMTTSITTGKDISNRGAAGDVYLEVTWNEAGKVVSGVFYMDSGEMVTAEASFGTVGSNPNSPSFEYTVRAASPGDQDEGSLTIERFGNFTMIAELPCGFSDLEVVNDTLYLIHEDYIHTSSPGEYFLEGYLLPCCTIPSAGNSTRITAAHSLRPPWQPACYSSSFSS